MSKKSIAQTPAPIKGRRIQTRRSGVHGKGVFALTDFAEGETIITGVIMPGAAPAAAGAPPGASNPFSGRSSMGSSSRGPR